MVARSLHSLFQYLTGEREERISHDLKKSWSEELTEQHSAS